MKANNTENEMKRFSETEKWENEWFSSLSPIQKLVYLFMLDKCDNAGFFVVNTRIHAFVINITETEYKNALSELSSCYDVKKDGKMDKIFIKNFISEQKNAPLYLNNNSHKQIFRILQNNEQDFDSHAIKQYISGACEGHECPPGIGIGNNKEKRPAKKITQNEEMCVFDEVRKMYPGIKRGLETEFKQFQKHKDWHDALSLLKPAIEQYISWRRKESSKPGAFVPDVPHFSTWINQRRWETVYDTGSPQAVQAEPQKEIQYDENGEPILPF